MDLGIGGRSAIVCTSSQGLGRACAEALAAEGVNVVVNGRDREKLDKAVAEIAASASGEVIGVAADITEPDGREALLAACPQPDILVLTTGARSRVRWPRSRMKTSRLRSTFTTARRSPSCEPCSRGCGRASGTRRRDHLGHGDVTERAHGHVRSGHEQGLTGVLKSLWFAAAADNVTIDELLPERFATQRQIDDANRSVERDGRDVPAGPWAAQAASIAAKRHGDPSEFGAMSAFLCGARRRGFVSGMNVHLDGGSYRGIV